METTKESDPHQGVRWNVILDLQETMSKSQPGNRTFEIADKAIDFALSSDRSPTRPDYFKRDVWRNAAHSIARRKRTHVDQPLEVLDNGLAVPEASSRSSSISERTVMTPEDITIGNDFHDMVSDLSEQVAPGLGAACVYGMLAGNTVQETAADLKVSPKTIKRVRAKIRTILTGIYREAA